MIILDHVSKQFNQSPVINDISLSIDRGEIVGFLGPNGAGKTTTVRMIAGILPPTQGKVTINDANLFADTVTSYPKIGYLPENNPIYDDMTVEEFLYHWAEMKDITRPHQQSAVEESVIETGLEDVYYRPISELSKGYRQRTGLAQAILDKPDILLLDEPTEGLDPNQRRDIHTLLSNLGQDRTVIICSHVLSEISRMANRILIISNGTIVADSPTEKMSQLGNTGAKYHVMISGKQIKKSLSELNGVTDVKKQDAKPAPVWTVQTNTNKDLRLTLFTLAKKQGWKLYELSQQDQDLEDVFARLTQ